MERQQPGEADFPDVVYHPEVVIDSSSRLMPGVKYGEVDFPEVVYHPEIVIDCRSTFILRIVPPSGKGPDEIAADLKPLFLALRDCELALGGTGLRFDPVPGGPGAVVFCVSATDPAGATDRLRVLAALLNHADTNGRVPHELADRARAAPGYRVEALAG